MTPRRTLAAAALALLPTLAAAQYAADALYDWSEGEVPPAPEWSTKNLIDVDLPGRSVRVGLDPATLTHDIKTGVVRYVAVARGVSAVNASYEGIRCTTGEWRVYARQIPGEEWQPASGGWQAMLDARSPHAYWFAKTGICEEGRSPRREVREMVRRLKSGRSAGD